MCLDVNRHLVSGHEISRLQYGLQLIMTRYTRMINCRPYCNVYIFAVLLPDLNRLYCILYSECFRK